MIDRRNLLLAGSGLTLAPGIALAKPLTKPLGAGAPPDRRAVRPPVEGAEL